jgi:hypothetical protein
MTSKRDPWLVASGLIMLTAAVLHLLAPIGGPAWYASLGAPAGLVAMAESGSMRPAISCVVIAAVLLVIAAYAFSAAGLLRRLPLRRAVLALVGSGLLLRGLSFLPLAAWQPHLLSGLCGRCEGVNAFLVVTSLLCLFPGATFVHAAVRARS